MVLSRNPIADVSEKSISELVSLRGRSAVVTGGAQGLGRAIANRLAQAGAAVAIADVDEALAMHAAADLGWTSPAKVVAAPLDVSDAASVASATAQIISDLGGIDIWVNNAGIFPRTPLLEMDDETWDKVLAVNLNGVKNGCRAASRAMIEAQSGGVIINVISTAGLRGTGPHLGAYVASKHGVTGLTKQLALELAPHRIRVLGIAPSVIVTEGVRTSREKTEKAGGQQFQFSCPLGRLGVPDDIGRVALFCASDLSIYMTGTVLPVDAGQLI